MMREQELSIVELTQRLKLGIGSRYGHKSNEYEQAKKAGKRSKKRVEEEVIEEGVRA
jgi:hypothetical protein